MEIGLDKRILKNPLSGFDGGECSIFLYASSKGYFGNYIEDFEDLSKAKFGTLMRLKNGSFSPCEDGTELYTFFLPEEWVAPEHPETYRPFSLDEFKSKFPLLSSITFREKDGGIVFTLCFLGYSVYKDNDYKFVTLGACEFRLSELFEEYELLDSDKFVPFGVKNE